jgi:hypothetical protein
VVGKPTGKRQPTTKVPTKGHPVNKVANQHNEAVAGKDPQTRRVHETVKKAQKDLGKKDQLSKKDLGAFGKGDYKKR